MYTELYDIPNFSNWKVIEKINKGWSSDSKFYIEDYKGNKLLLRISDISEYNDKKDEFNFIKKCNTLKFIMSQAIEIGVCNNKKNTYMLLSWVEGDSLDSRLNDFTEDEQYRLGLQAGEILKEIHSIKTDPMENIIVDNKTEKILTNLVRYEKSKNRVKEDQVAIDFVRSNINKINSLNSVYKHCDYHVGNLVLTPLNTIGVIDFNRWSYGDRYEEFQRIQSFDIEVSVPFSIGKIQGYFNGNPSLEFWSILAIYVAYTSLYSIVWAEKFGQKDIDGMKKRCLNAFDDYDNFNTVIPKWYKLNSNKYI